ncbi:MAG: hypothetical protein AB1505_34135, partial [Candidatus Latescibacterota bacterium]
MLLVVSVLAGLLVLPGTGAAQLYRFGKNKVQFTDFDWRQMETPHFDVYFFPEEAELASYAARMAEEGYARLEQVSAHTVQRRIPLIVYSSHIYFEQTNVIPNLLPEGVGGFTEYLKGRVALPLSGSLPEFERVLHHELVHVFTFDRIRRTLERHGISEFRPPPLWFSEGLAEYWSGEWTPFSDMVIRDALFSRRLVPIGQIYTIEGSYQMYKEGESICRFMAERYGSDVFELLLASWWRAEEFGQVLQIVTGESLDELDEEWQYDLRKRYLPDIARGDLPSHMAEQLTHEGFNVRPEVIPGDTSSFVFFRNDQGYTHIARLSLGQEEPEVVVEGERSPAYESLHPLSTRPAVAPDGRRLAFAAQHRGRDHLFIWDLGARRQVADLAFERVVAISSPSWSPDGRRVALSGADPGGITDLYVVDVEGGEVYPLTRDIYHDRDPAWSPDGRWIAFSSDRWSGGRQGRYNLFLHAMEGGTVLRLTHGEHSDLEPAWSPDGKALAFVSDRDTMFDVHAVRLEERAGGEVWKGPEVRLTEVLTGAFGPAWVPGKGGLLFSGLEGGAFHIYHLEQDPDSLLAAMPQERLSPAEGEAWTLRETRGGLRYNQRPYKAEMSLDIAQSQIYQDPEFGTSGGVQLALSDVLGDDQYFFVLSHIAGSEAGFLDGLNTAVARRHHGARA